VLTDWQSELDLSAKLTAVVRYAGTSEKKVCGVCCYLPYILRSVCRCWPAPWLMAQPGSLVLCLPSLCDVCPAYSIFV